jgi:hypothetical protein
MVQKARKECLYPKKKGCEKRWLLHFFLDVLILKGKYGWSYRSFNDLLTLFAAVLSKPNFVPGNTYQAKKIIYPLTMGVELIHACLNHCILYRVVLRDQTSCPTYDASRYKRNNNCREGTNTRKK